MEFRSSSRFIWNIKDVLGQGATGAVYKGREKKTGDMFAIKTSNHLGMMRPAEIRQREYDVLRKLKHENIVKIYDSDKENRTNNEIIVMELCSGGSLFTMLEHPSNAYGFSERNCKDIIKDVVAGMKHLREQGIVHRDLKPGNIMRKFKDDGSCVYKLIDFGASRELMASDQFVSIYGTEEYLHPDLYERGVLRKNSSKTFGAQVDLWSVGVTFYHIATGKLPFRPYGGRQNKDTMYHITTKKKSGMISGVQKSESGDVEWSDRLPDQTQLSQGFKDLLTPILAGVLESDPSKMMSFEEFFHLVQDMITRKVIDVYSVSSSTFHKIYIRPRDTITRFQQLTELLTGVGSAHQMLFFNSENFQPAPTAEAATYPKTTRDKPVIMIGGEFIAKDSLQTRKIPNVTPLPDEWTLEGDSAAAKIMANCAYSCEHSVKMYSDAFKCMADTMEFVINEKNERLKSYLTIATTARTWIEEEMNWAPVKSPPLPRTLKVPCTNSIKQTKKIMVSYDSVCEQIMSKRIAVQQLTNVLSASLENTIAMLEELICEVHIPEEEKTAIEDDIRSVKTWIKHKRQTDATLTEEANEWLNQLQPIIVDVLKRDTLSVMVVGFTQLSNSICFLPTVATFKQRIEDINNRFKKEKHHRRLSYPDEQNHIFDRTKLAEYFSRVTYTTNACSKHRATLHDELVNWIIQAKAYEERALKLQPHMDEIRLRDDAHLQGMETLQLECQERCRRIVQRIKAAMAASPSTSVGTDPPSMAVHVNGVASREGTAESAFWLDLESQLAVLTRVSETSKVTARENTEQLKKLTTSFNDFFQLVDESGKQSIEELQKLSTVEQH